MIDLKKLQDKFDTLFEQETEESFNLWLEDKVRKDIIASLGIGELQNLNIKTNCPQIVPNKPYFEPLTLQTKNNLNSFQGSIQYCMAA